MNFKKMAAILAISLTSVGANAQQTYEWKDATANGYKYRYVTNDPMQTRFYTLKNGLTVILSPTNKDPRMQVYIATKAGSKTDPATNTGLAHYLEHMLFKGTTNYGSLDWSKEKPLLAEIDKLYEEYNHTKDEAKRKIIYKRIDSVSGVASKFAIANEYDKLMSGMGAQGTNAFTSFEQTVYTEDIPANSVDKFLKVQSDRFQNPVFRIFHTELEAVYEEKNRSLDNDGRKASEMMWENLFRNHNYGKQTTIGTIEHLKNPSMLEIKKYFKTYYVPNNMAVIVSGDFQPDVMIAKVDKAFEGMKAQPVPKYTFKPEVPITKPIVKEVFGPDAEFVTISWRLPGVHSKDALIADLVSEVLANGRAGLMDLNLVKKQKLLRAGGYAYILIDHGVMNLQGNPTLGQSLDDVKTLMMGEVENLKKGNFDDELLTSVVNNQKKALMQMQEGYGGRARMLMSGFTGEEDWRNSVAYIDRLSKLTKKDIVDFANRYLGNDNYVQVYKRKGEDKNVLKVEKPTITPVETNAGKQSQFVKDVVAMPSTPLSPVWIDYNKDLQRTQAGPAELLYVQNKDNGLFRMSYRFKMGTYNDKRLSLAANYLQFLGTDKMSAEDYSKEFYKLACSFSMNAGGEYTTLSVEGLQENFPKAVQLFDELINNCKPDEAALTALKARSAKSRVDAKNNKGAIMQGLVSYAKYGKANPFNNVMSNAEMDAITAQQLVDIIHNMPKMTHRIIYYGPQSMDELSGNIASLHKMPATFKDPSGAREFKPVDQPANEVLFANYDMVQSEVRWIRNVPGYDAQRQCEIDVFNNYFGGNMGAIVFQTIRESKALAYSTSAVVQTPDKKEDPYTVTAYVGCQADKFNESVTAMNELLTDLPQVESNLAAAKASIRQDIETERITQDGIIYNYLSAERRGLKEDIRKDIYARSGNMDYATLKKFHGSYLSGQPYTYCILGSDKKLKEGDMAKIGKVKKLSMEEIFGY